MASDMIARYDACAISREVQPKGKVLAIDVLGSRVELTVPFDSWFLIFDTDIRQESGPKYLYLFINVSDGTMERSFQSGMLADMSVMDVLKTIGPSMSILPRARAATRSGMEGSIVSESNRWAVIIDGE